MTENIYTAHCHKQLHHQQACFSSRNKISGRLNNTFITRFKILKSHCYKCWTVIIFHPHFVFHSSILPTQVSGSNDGSPFLLDIITQPANTFIAVLQKRCHGYCLLSFRLGALWTQGHPHYTVFN